MSIWRKGRIRFAYEYESNEYNCIHPRIYIIDKEIIDYFWFNVDKRGDNECWIWNGKINNGGYGFFDVWETKILAHRMSYIIHKGKIFNGNLVHHSCNNTLCVNPNHLEQVTHKEHGKEHKQHGKYIGGRWW